MKRRWILLSVSGLASWIAIAVLSAPYLDRDERNYTCLGCWSWRENSQWRLGDSTGFSIPLAPDVEREHPSHLCLDLLGPGHLHQWRYEQGSPTYPFGKEWDGCALGEGHGSNPLAAMFEDDAGFRAFIKRRLDSGVTERIEFIAAALINGENREERAWMNRRYVELLVAFNRGQDPSDPP